MTPTFAATEIWGVAWSRTGDNEGITWYDTEEEAVAEYNSRDDKYWPSTLVRSGSIQPVTVHRTETPPWENDYTNHQYLPR